MIRAIILSIGEPSRLCPYRAGAHFTQPPRCFQFAYSRGIHRRHSSHKTQVQAAGFEHSKGLLHVTCAHLLKTRLCGGPVSCRQSGKDDSHRGHTLGPVPTCTCKGRFLHCWNPQQS